MLRILHTSDLHLHRKEDERWEALIQLLEIGGRQGIDLLVISGDLFNQNIDAENLANEIRQAFSAADFKIFLLPGNHDERVFSGGKYFGEGVEVLTGQGQPVEYKGVFFWGLPFETLDESAIIRRLHDFSERASPEKHNVLVYHGELLDPRFSRRDMGEEGERRYMPVKLSCFDRLPFQYVLAGHYHTQFRIWQHAGGYFVYPGSPVSITKREKGRRKANLFEIGRAPSEILLDTFHFEEVVVELDPFSKEDPLEEIAKKLEGLHPCAQVELQVKGFFNSDLLGRNEQELMEEIQRTVSGEKNVRLLAPEFKDISRIMEDGLAVRFMQKMEERVGVEKAQATIYKLFVQAMLEAKE